MRLRGRGCTRRLLDNLPAVYLEGPLHQRDYTRGVPIGSTSRGTTFLYNHIRFVVSVHTSPDLEGFRVVGLEATPVSFGSVCAPRLGDFDLLNVMPRAWLNVSRTETARWVEQGRPALLPMLHGCTPAPSVHSWWPLGRLCRAVWTYDVVWKPSAVRWATRWDAYLTMGRPDATQVHLLSLFNSVILVVLLLVRAPWASLPCTRMPCCLLPLPSECVGPTFPALCVQSCV
jgi:transmembrane 9 superfamily protein 2/4